MALTPAEANMLAKAGIDVAKLYDFDIGPEAVAWGNLIIAGVSVYGTRVAAIMFRLKKEQARDVTPPQASAFQPPIPASTVPPPQEPFAPPQATDAAAAAGTSIGPAHYK